MSGNFEFSRAELDEYRSKVLANASYDDIPAAPSLYGSIKDVDVEEGLDRILHFEKEERGIDWRAFYENKAGEISKVDAYLRRLGAKYTAATLLGGEKVTDLPNYAISNGPTGNYIDEVIRLRGEDIQKYVVWRSQDFQIAQRNFGSDVAGAASGLFGAGLMGVGLKWTKSFWKGIRAGGKGRASAVTAAEGLGGPFCGNMCGLLVSWGIRCLLDKKAQMLAVVVNRTGNEMSFADSYAANGKVLTVPRVHDAAESTDRAAIVEAQRFDGREIASAGWINASKRDSALVGVKAGFKLTFAGRNENYFKNGAFLGFSVPYSGKNDCGCSLDAFPSAEAFLDKEYPGFALGQEKGSPGGAQMQAYVNSPKGGEVYMLAVCQAPYPEELD